MGLKIIVMKNIKYNRLVICSLILFVNQYVYAQSGESYHNSICTDVHCIYGGTYNLIFNEGYDETTLTIDMPEGISATLVDYNNDNYYITPPYGITGVYCGAYPITGCFYEGDRLSVIMNKGLDRYTNGTIVTLTIETNKPYSYFPNGYCFIHVDLVVNK